MWTTGVQGFDTLPYDCRSYPQHISILQPGWFFAHRSPAAPKTFRRPASDSRYKGSAWTAGRSVDFLHLITLYKHINMYINNIIYIYTHNDIGLCLYMFIYPYNFVYVNNYIYIPYTYIFMFMLPGDSCNTHKRRRCATVALPDVTVHHVTLHAEMSWCDATGYQ